MESPDPRFFDLVGVVRSWLPRRTEPPNLSRDFWMPDNSCRVCYECDSQFTIFNRRHHCRLCGRIFCSQCTTNSISAPFVDTKSGREEWEKIRVCNYCFKRWEQEFMGIDNGMQLSSPDLSPSPSAASLVSNKSSGTPNSNSGTVFSMPYSTGSYQHVQYTDGLSPGPPPQGEAGADKQGLVTSKMNIESAADTGDSSPRQFGFSMNRSALGARSDDEDDEYSTYRSDSDTRQFQPSDDYYGHFGFDGTDHGYRSHKVHPTEENADAADLNSPRGVIPGKELQVTSSCKKLNGEVRVHDNTDELDPSSSIYDVDNADAEPVDFENNGLLWLPPEPEDEEDDREAVIFYDDDDEDTTGEWKTLCSSSSFGSGEYRNRERSSEEHKKAMKNIVDGHFRALVAQLLQAENLPAGDEGDKESWLDIITSLSWEAATLLKPDTSKGGGMDPGGYVKVKCIACGHCSESMVVKGVVCKKNVAHRRMTSKIRSPRLLLLGGALEYQRVTNNLSSIDTLLQQEMDHLKMAVARIDKHKPDILLVEKSVSRRAQECLLDKDISLVLNIKRPLLERIARCTGAQIVPSIDSLSSQKLGQCESFRVEKFVEEHGSASQNGKKLVKTLMFFEGCPRPLGYTILLKGASSDELKKVKHVLQYGVFAAYHLALETCFLADEGALLPELPLKSPITVALPDKPSSIDRCISTIPGFKVSASGKVQPDNDVQRLGNIHKGDPSFAIDCPSTTSVEGSVMPYTSKDLNSQILEPASEQIKHAVFEMKKLPYGDLSSSISLGQFAANHYAGFSPYYPFDEQSKLDFGDLHFKGGHLGDGLLITENQLVPANHFKDQMSDGGRVGASNIQVNDQRTVANMVSSDLRSFHQDNGQRDDPASAKEEFPPSPSDHQSILVSLSTRCVWKGTVCERSHLLRIKYYGSFDKPLGRFLRDHLFDQNFRCRSCEMPSEAHVHCYTHRHGSLTISVKKHAEFALPGEREGKIWMWHRCLRCPRINGFPPATRRIVMSDAAWGLSFGKFLELSFSNHAAASRVASCGHSLHRDCLRFYGFGKMVACFRYASIDLHSVYLPPSKLDFNYHLQDWIQKEADELVEGAELLFSEVSNALHQIVEKRVGSGSVDSGMKILESRCQIAELETVLQKEKKELEESLQKILKRDPRQGQPVVDILDINRLRRHLLYRAYVWDQCLLLATGPENSLKDEMSSSIPKSKEKPLNSMENLLETNLVAKPSKTLSVSGPLPSDSRSDEMPKGISHPAENHRGGVEQDAVHKREKSYSFSTSVVINDHSATAEGSNGVRRVLSDGQFPINLSDTLDAAWTGENHPAGVVPQENGSGIPHEPVVESSHLVEASAATMKVEDAGLVGSVGAAQPFVPTIHSKGAEHLDELPSWTGTPLLDFFRSAGKIPVPRLDALGEFTPVYVSSFCELDRHGGGRLRLPAGMNETIVPVYDDEPTSVIAYALVSSYYHSQMSDEKEKPKDSGDSSVSLPFYDSVSFHPFQLFDETYSESFRSSGSSEDSISTSGSKNSLAMDPLTYTKAMHVRVPFADDGPPGKVRYTVTCYYAKRFDALRKTCCQSETDFIRSLSRCKKWGAQGGKSNVFFAKTSDDRFIIKQVTKTELESFIKFAPEYFKYLSEAIATGSPTCLAKILGIYQVTSKHVKGGKESKMDVLVMENLLFGRNITRLYDLKGSSRSRYNPDSSGSNKVLLDQNLIEAMPTSPIFVGNKAKRLLERAVWNDTSFLASIYVMDYSLLVGVDEERHELVLGIIDFMRQYTWDKHLETWVKASGILGGPKNASPTVISPKQYKKRFRKAMSTYFLTVPDQWSPPAIIPSRSQSDLAEENQQGS